MSKVCMNCYVKSLSVIKPNDNLFFKRIWRIQRGKTTLKRFFRKWDICAILCLAMNTIKCPSCLFRYRSLFSALEVCMLLCLVGARNGVFRSRKSTTRPRGTNSGGPSIWPPRNSSSDPYSSNMNITSKGLTFLSAWQVTQL